MDFSYKKFPVLREIASARNLIRLGKRNSITIPIHNKIKYTNVYNAAFHAIRNGVKKNGNINYISKSIIRVFDEDLKTADKLWRLRDEVKDVSGVFITPQGIVYAYLLFRYKSEMKAAIFVFDKNNIGCFYSGGWDIGSYYEQVGYHPGMSFDLADNEETKKIRASKGFDENYSVAFPLQFVVSFEIFKMYAEIETYIINGKTKIRRKGDEIHDNKDFPYKINIVDSSYFREIIRTEGFKVRGHFGLRAYGEGRKKRRLVWINEYEKSGYHRRAGKTIIEEN